MTTEFVLYAQHGWADDSRAIATLAQAVAPTQAQIIAPDLGWVRTWLRIQPLIQQVEQVAIDTLSRYPDLPMKIIGHSMGGLIWLEVLHRHPEWWSQVEALVLVASPVGGADLARILDPFGIGIGIARDLGINRRAMAEAIAATIPTLIIAGDTDAGSDGTITLESTKFNHAQFMRLPDLSHAVLKNHPAVADAICNFWAHPDVPTPNLEALDFKTQLIQRLQQIKGLTDAHQRDFRRSKVVIRFKNGLSLRTWRNPLQVAHIFVADPADRCLYAGFVGWVHTDDLHQALEEIKQRYDQEILI
ncbi:MAG: alpha/beta hydrolase [Cyanothece sp. SIO1E1]|nr:alpha/beta hydrolase [Cyanothece sp. SIO1E1]